MQKSFGRMLLILAACLSFGRLAFSQAGTDSSKGSLYVNVKDASGASVPDTQIKLQGPMGDSSATTNDRGEANFFTLVPGQYRVLVTKSGFQTSSVNVIPVQATVRSSINVILQPGQITQTVEVSGEAATVDTTSTTIQTDLNAAEYQNLPVGRNLTNLFYLAPGVASGGGTGQANPSISGASGLENQYIIDGINDTDSGYGGFGVYSEVYGSLGTGVNFDFVKEVQIKTGGFEAQYGQALGGIVNVVTNSGGNSIHGSAYVYSNPSWATPSYNQVNPLRTGAPQTEIWGQHQIDYGLNVGGPFIKNKFFWYGAFNPSYNYVQRNSAPAFTLRTADGYSRLRRSLNWVGKLNYNITDSHRLEATAYGDPSRSPATVQGSLNRNNTDSTSSLDYGTRNWAVKYSGTFGPQTLASASFAWNRSAFTEAPLTNTFSIRDYSEPTTSSIYTLRGGLGYLSNNVGNNKQYNTMVSRTVNLLGTHQIDIGYSYNEVNYDAIHEYTGPGFALQAANGIDAADIGKTVYGGYFYEYVNRKVAGTVYPLVYRQTRGNFSSPAVTTVTKYQDVFLQDAYQMNRFFTIKAGVRWEQQRLEGNVNNYTMGGNWAPRLGFIVDPFGRGKTKIFANYGLFFEKIPQDLAVRALSSESGYSNGYYLTLPTATDPGTLVPGTTFSPVGVSPTIIYGGTRAAYQREITAGVEQEFGHGLLFRASYMDRSLIRGLEDTSGITVEQALAGSPQQYVIQNPNIHSDTFFNATTCVDGTPNCTNGSGYTDNSGALGGDGTADGFPDMRRVYNSLELSIEKRFSHNWSLISNYRLAKLFGNYEGSFRNDNGQSDPNITSLFDFVNSPAIADQFKVGVLPTDRRNIINLYGSYQLGSHWNLGLGYTSQSGSPLSQFDAHPAYGNAGEIPVGGRGSEGRTPWQNYVDMKAGYDMPLGETKKLRFSADMFNLFNRQTSTDIDQDHQLDGGVPNPDFLKPLTYHRPFYARFSARFEF